MKVTFKEWTCEIVKKLYTNGRICLRLIDVNDACPVVTATVNIPDITLAPNEVIIKDYAENEGVLELLLKEGIVKPTCRIVRYGDLTMQICEVLI